MSLLTECYCFDCGEVLEKHEEILCRTCLEKDDGFYEIGN